MSTNRQFCRHGVPVTQCIHFERSGYCEYNHTYPKQNAVGDFMKPSAILRCEYCFRKLSDDRLLVNEMYYCNSDCSSSDLQRYLDNDQN